MLGPLFSSVTPPLFYPASNSPPCLPHLTLPLHLTSSFLLPHLLFFSHLTGMTSNVPEVQELAGELAKKVSSSNADLNPEQIGRVGTPSFPFFTYYFTYSHTYSLAIYFFNSSFIPSLTPSPSPLPTPFHSHIIQSTTHPHSSPLSFHSVSIRPARSILLCLHH